MTKTILWLDDLRNPEERIWLDKLIEFGINTSYYNIIWVKTYKEFVNWIKKYGLPHGICFDHDLADNHKLRSELDVTEWYDMTENSEYTGYDCAKWLVEYCMDNEEELPKFYVHSANPVGADNIRGLLNNYLNYFQK